MFKGVTAHVTTWDSLPKCLQLSAAQRRDDAGGKILYDVFLVMAMCQCLQERLSGAEVPGMLANCTRGGHPFLAGSVL